MAEITEQLKRNYWIQKTISSVLKLSLEPISLKEQLGRALDLILSIPWLSLESKGCIFLVDEDRRSLILTVQRGLPEELLTSCARIPFGHCLCGQAASTGKLIFADHLDKRHKTRYEGIKEHGHYCVPIMVGQRQLGVINTYIHPGHVKDKMEVNFLFAIANTIASVIERKRAEEALLKAKAELEVTVENLKLSLEPISLKKQMERTLDLIMSIPWLSLESKGCIFLVGKDSQTLEMIAQRGLSKTLLSSCARVRLGHCLCGRAAASQKLVFADHLDKRHETRYEGIKEHGHYCIPILSHKRLLGVINMYITKGHKKNKTEEEFLRSIANTLAGVIERKRAEEALQNAKNELEVIVKKRTDKLKQLHRQNKLILDAVAEGICGVDKRGIITFINPAVITITGYDPEELIGYNFHNLLHSETSDMISHSRQECPIQDTIDSGESHSVINEIHTKKDNTSYSVEYESTPIWEKGEIIGAVITFRDITQRRRAEEEVERSLEKLSKALHGTVDALSVTSETRDPYTAGHQRQVTKLACAIAQKMGLDQDTIEGIRLAALLHDIGKIYVPAEFLSKPGQLTDIEHHLLETHPQVGYDILKSIDFSWPVAEIVLQHHEKMDGSGYPRGLSGPEILLEARIIAIADITEAMSSHRPYRPSLGIKKALKEIKQHKNTLYDPDVVDVCVQLFSKKAFEFDTTESKK
jgi:PAS domain S-box-containing protein/putative nucleotidyltransferase with HDIG domain